MLRFDGKDGSEELDVGDLEWLFLCCSILTVRLFLVTDKCTE